MPGVLRHVDKSLGVLYVVFTFVDFLHISGPGSSVGIATDYGLDGPGIESRWR